MISGVRELFKKMNLPKTGTYLIIGPPETKKTRFIVGILTNLGEKKGVYVTTDKSPGEVKQLFETLKPKLKDPGELLKKISIIDCYTWSLGQRKISDKNKIPGPTALNELGIALGEAIKKSRNPLIVVFDSLSTLLMYNQPSSIFKFMQVMNSRAKAKDSSVFYVVEEGMHDKQTQTSLEHLTDADVALKVTDIGESLVRFKRKIETGWIHLTKQKEAKPKESGKKTSKKPR